MSTKTETIALPEGGVATPNGDGSYTISGYTGDNAEMNGVWVSVPEGTADAINASELNIGVDGYFVKQ